MKHFLFLILLTNGMSLQAQDPQLSSEIVWAERISAGQYLIKNQDKAQWNLYVGSSLDAIQWNNPQVLVDSLVIGSAPTERMFFAAVRNKDTLFFSERRLWMDAAPNFRDLGGIKTTDGKTVVWNTLFRCGDMGNLTEADLSVLSKLKVNQVVDFRNEQEVEKSPDKYPSDQEVRRIWTSISPANGESMKQFYAIMSNPSVSPAEVERVFEGFYAKMPENVQNYKPFFDALLDPMARATVFHCTAGKDRTGLGAALLLAALGVPEELVIEEYYISNRYTVKALSKSLMPGIRPEIAEVLAGVKPEYIRASLNTIKAKYGTVATMLEQELELSPEKLKMLKALYTY